MLVEGIKTLIYADFSLNIFHSLKHIRATLVNSLHGVKPW